VAIDQKKILKKGNDLQKKGIRLFCPAGKIFNFFCPAGKIYILLFPVQGKFLTFLKFFFAPIGEKLCFFSLDRGKICVFWPGQAILYNAF
jgi:hypothetical protein